MKIGFDAQALTSPTWNHGIGRLTLGFINALAKHDKDNQYFLIRLPDRQLPVPSPFEVIDLRVPKNLHPSDLAANFEYGKSVAAAIDRLGIEVYHVTTPVTVFTYFPALTNCPVVSTFYDLIPAIMHYYPSCWPSEAYTAYLQRLLLAKRFTDRFAAISSCTKKDLINELRIWPSRIDVVYPALDDSFKAGASSAGVDKNYLLYVGGGDPRKNLTFLFKAYSCLSESLRSSFKLVIDVEEELQPRLRQLASHLGIHQNVRFSGYPDDKTLLDLYRNCTALVIPSLYEGFGLPLLEAMSFSKPILASNRSSIPEIVGDAALLFDPGDCRDAANKMAKLLSDKELQKQLGQKGSRRLSKFSWDKSVQELEHVYKSAIDNKKAGRTTGRIAYFSPLYPKQSGISEYSTELLKELAKQARVDVFVDKPKAISKFREYKDLELRKASEFEELWRDYSLALYQMGNSTYHSFLLEILTNRPGLVVFHDFNLHNFLFHHAIEKSDELTYLCAMAFQHGEKGLLLAKAQLDAGIAIDRYIQQYPLNTAILLFAESAISVGKRITEYLSSQVSPPVTIIPLGANLLDDSYLKTQRTQSRKLLGLSELDFVFFVGGLIEREEYHQKRLGLCLQVFKQVLDQVPDSRLLIGGIIDNYVLARLEEDVSRLELTDQVVLRGCKDFPRDLDLCACASDVSINLRRAANALASGSTIKDLSRGLPVIASNNELYREFPDDCVWKVDEEAEERLLFEYMLYLATHREVVETMSKNAHKFIATRSWDQVAKSYAQVIRDQLKRS
jgi:glycosyltransferase involved in cell wall biosynthesis